MAKIETIQCWDRLTRDGTGWAFPRKVDALLRERVAARAVLHLFGGFAKFGLRLDVDPLVRPDVIGDALLPPFGKDSFDVVILDPPYTYINGQMKSQLFGAAGWIAREEVWWFHTHLQSTLHPLRLVETFVVLVNSGCAARVLQKFVPVPWKRAPRRRFFRGHALKYNRWFIPPEGLPFPPSSSAVESAMVQDPAGQS